MLDISAAFDVDHSILLCRLHVGVGITGVVLDSIMSFLTCRTQQVAYNSQLSVMHCHNWGGDDRSASTFFRQNVSRFLSHSSWYERRSVRQTASAATAAATSAAMRTVEAATRRWAHLDARSKRRTRRLAARHSSSKYESEDRWRHVTIRNGISQVSPWSHCHTKAPDHRRCCLPTFLVDRAATKTAEDVTIKHALLADFSGSVDWRRSTHRYRPLQEVMIWQTNVYYVDGQHRSVISYEDNVEQPSEVMGWRGNAVE